MPYKSRADKLRRGREYSRRPDVKARRRAQWRGSTAQRVRALHYNRFRRYGITSSQFDALFISQGKRCAVCRADKNRSKRGWTVDHDHATGNVRGVLCGPCNSALGLMQDSPLRLRQGAAYLERHA